MSPTFTVRDSVGSVIAVTPGSATYALTQGADKVGLSGDVLTGLQPGTATIVATVDGISSAATTVTVTTGTRVTIPAFSGYLKINDSHTFSATVTGTSNTGVTWSIQEAGGGTITSGGSYTAPATAGVYHLVATSVFDTTQQGVLAVTVHPIVTVTTAAPTISAGDTATFTATVQGATNQAVGWSIDEGQAAGSVNSQGVYTAPAAIGTYHVRATSQADTAASGTATINVQGAGGTVIIQ